VMTNHTTIWRGAVFDWLGKAAVLTIRSRAEQIGTVNQCHILKLAVSVDSDHPFKVVSKQSRKDIEIALQCLPQMQL